MTEFDIYVPLKLNDGTPVEPTFFIELQQRLLDFFAGCSFFPQPIHGLWTMEGVTYRDEIVVYRVVTAKTAQARRFLKKLKKELKESLEQEEIFIVERHVGLL